MKKLDNETLGGISFITVIGLLFVSAWVFYATHWPIVYTFGPANSQDDHIGLGLLTFLTAIYCAVILGIGLYVALKAIRDSNFNFCKLFFAATILVVLGYEGFRHLSWK